MIEAQMAKLIAFVSCGLVSTRRNLAMRLSTPARAVATVITTTAAPPIMTYPYRNSFPRIGTWPVKTACVMALSSPAFGGGGEELAEGGGELPLFPPGERAEDALVVLTDGLAQVCEGRPPGRGDRHHVPAAVMGIAGALRVPQCLQPVEQLHHVAAVDARGRAQLLLGGPTAGVEDHQDQVLLGADAPARQHVLEAGAHGGAHPGQQESGVGHELRRSRLFVHRIYAMPYSTCY